MFRLLIVVSALTGGWCQQISFNDCGSSATIQSVSGICNGICHLRIGVTYGGNITFTPTKDSRSATTHFAITAITVDGEHTFPVVTEDACSKSIHCPLNAGVQQTFMPSAPVPNIQTQTRLIGEWRLVGDDGTNILCVHVPFFIDSQ